MADKPQKPKGEVEKQGVVAQPSLDQQQHRQRQRQAAQQDPYSPAKPMTNTPSSEAPASMNTQREAQRVDPFNVGTTGPYPEFTSGLTFAEVGRTGLRAFSGWVREEFLPELQGRQAAQKYREMLDNSPIIGAIIFAINATMRKVEWRTVTANDTPEAQEMADFVDSCREDMSHTWEDLMIENLSMLVYGFAPHEIVYKRRIGRDPPGLDQWGQHLPSSDYDDGKIGWRRIPLRGQDTILKWFFDANGQTKGLTQQPWVGPLIDIPIEKMLLFRPLFYKNNPEGRSILRSSYTSYYYAKRMQEMEAILGERLGGIPVLNVPAALFEAAKTDAAAKQSLDNFKKIATNIRVDEQMGVVFPSDPYMSANGPSNVPQYKLELVTPTGGGMGRTLNFDVTITRLNTQILTSTMTDFLMMGHQTRGAQNLAETKVDMFFQAIEGYLNANAAVYNRYALPRLWKLNGFDLDLMPRLEPDLAQRLDLDVLSNFVLRLSQAGMPLFPNEELQTFLLDAGGLPDIEDERALAAAGLLDDQIGIDVDEAGRAQILPQPEPTLATPGMGGGQPGQRNAPPGPVPTRPGVAASQRPGAPGRTPPGQRSPLEKMILAGIAKRALHQGPRFGINTRKHRHGRRA